MKEFADGGSDGRIWFLELHRYSQNQSARETQGIVLVETMSAGCAILSSDSIACKETISEDIGFWVGIDNTKEIEGKLQELLESENALVRIIQNARSKFDSQFRYDNIIKDYENIIKSITQI